MGAAARGLVGGAGRDGDRRVAARPALGARGLGVCGAGVCGLGVCGLGVRGLGVRGLGVDRRAAIGG
ncbi:MAG TPA: hypothetical protein RMH26_11355, partial [Polyangiaceae bacterium LLY-WYZ-15_(1-7)]|nr:hypothetical protein [Polyangiaceae bacterium LLY-WYZ-15_(1-7)]